jgi:RNA polymerase sigma-70 factor, ECF subfamily
LAVDATKHPNAEGYRPALLTAVQRDRERTGACSDRPASIQFFWGLKPTATFRNSIELFVGCSQLILEAHVPATPQQLYEHTLVLRSQIGDEAAFRELLELHGPHLLRYTRKMMEPSPAQVEDLIQEIWVAIYRGLPGLLDAGKFRAWVFRIARDRIYREYRKRKIVLQPLVEDESWEFCESPQETVNSEELHHGLGLIPREQREVLVLRYFEEMSYEEIAHVTGCTLGTVRSRIHYAKRALKTAIEKRKI